MEPIDTYSASQLRLVLRLQAAWLSGDFGTVGDVLQSFGTEPPIFAWAPALKDLPDERLQAIYKIWLEHKGKAELPLSPACQVSAYGNLAGIMMILDFCPDGLNLSYRHYGDELASHAGSSWHGKTSVDMARFSEHSLLFASGYLAVASLRQPLYSEIVSSPLMALTTWCRLLLPYVNEQGRVVSFACSNLPIPGSPHWRSVGGKQRSLASPTTASRQQTSEKGQVSGFEVMARNIRNMLTQAPTAVLVLARQSGRVVFGNEPLTSMFGYKLVDLLDTVPTRIFDTAADFSGLHELLVQGGVVKHREVKVRHRDGREIWALLSAYEVVYDFNPALAFWFFDISDQKQAAQELLAAKAAAEAASRAKSMFLANMSHEIRTPLNAVIGFTELLLETPLTETQKQYAQHASQSGAVLLDIVNDVLDLAKIEAGKLDLDPCPTNIVAFVKLTTELIAVQAARKGLDFTVEVSPDVPQWLFLDPVRLRQVLLNLLGNALKFTSRGFIKLELKRIRDEPFFDRLQLSVADFGIGISAE